MMNKTEFEARVREKARLEADRIRKRNKIIRAATAIAGTVAAAACVMLVITRMDSVVSDKFGSASQGIMNNSGIMNEGMGNADSDDFCDSVTPSEDAMENLPDEIPDDGVDVESADKNDIIAGGTTEGLFPEMNTIPETIKMVTYPNGDGETELSQDDAELIMDWICSLKLKDTGKKDNDKNGLLYKFELTYPDVVREIYVFDNMIKVDNSTWFEFTRKKLKEFEKIIS